MFKMRDLTEIRRSPFAGSVVILMVCLLSLAGLSKNWDGDVLGQLMLFRGGIAHATTGETGPDHPARFTPGGD